MGVHNTLYKKQFPTLSKEQQCKSFTIPSFDQTQSNYRQTG